MCEVHKGYAGRLKEMIVTASRHPNAKAIFESLRGAEHQVIIAHLDDVSIIAVIKEETVRRTTYRIHEFFAPYNVNFEFVTEDQYAVLNKLYEETMAQLPPARQPLKKAKTWHCKSFMGARGSDTLRKNAINFMNTNELTFENCRLFEYLGPGQITVIAVYYLK